MGARIAVQFVVNYEEGAESCVLHGDPAAEAYLSELIGRAAGKQSTAHEYGVGI